ncbi:MAG TPA: GNAT family N-acetyltransferase [Mycobacteriales bacterium]|nr:GNAT family N-acetyltransferase [Mycobacteriales bacterium]
MTSEQVEVALNAKADRFEISVDGVASGHVRFHDLDGVRIFTHTEIDSKFEGRGLGGRLVGAALDQTRAAGLRVEPECPFVRRFIERNEEYADLVGAA